MADTLRRLRTKEDNNAPVTYLITGAAGFFGRSLAAYLLRTEPTSHVRLFDIRPAKLPASVPLSDLRRVTTFVGDLRNPSDIHLALGEPGATTCVFHACSYGMSGAEQYDCEMCEAVNVQGTRRLLDACLELGVRALVHTSTVNVVFHGQEVAWGDESMAYSEEAQITDNYCRTKAAAERLVLEVDGTRCSSGKKGTRLRTCAIRPPGIYGKGEERHFPRIMRIISSNQFCFTFGKKDAKVDFIHVDNLITAHCAAARGLLPASPTSSSSSPSSSSPPRSSGSVSSYAAPAPAGRAYFVSDGAPINNFEFFCPLAVGYGKAVPRVRVPLRLMLLLAAAIEWAHRVVSPFLAFTPFITRGEVFKAGVSHFFKIDAAKRDLKWTPTVRMRDVMPDIVDFYVAAERRRQASQPRSRAIWLVIAVATCVTVLVVVAVHRGQGTAGPADAAAEVPPQSDAMSRLVSALGWL